MLISLPIDLSSLGSVPSGSALLHPGRELPDSAPSDSDAAPPAYSAHLPPPGRLGPGADAGVALVFQVEIDCPALSYLQPYLAGKPTKYFKCLAALSLDGDWKLFVSALCYEVKAEIEATVIRRKMCKEKERAARRLRMDRIFICWDCEKWAHEKWSDMMVSEYNWRKCLTMIKQRGFKDVLRVLVSLE